MSTFSFDADKISVDLDNDPDLHRTTGSCQTCGYTVDPYDHYDVLKHGYCQRCWTSPGDDE